MFRRKWEDRVSASRNKEPVFALKEMTLNFETMSDQQLWAIADPIMDNLMDASTQLDHARHVRDFTGRLKAIVTPDYFQCICQQY